MSFVLHLAWADRGKTRYIWSISNIFHCFLLLLLYNVDISFESVNSGLAKANRWPREKKKFYHQFSSVKYSYLPTDTFRKYVERHVTWSKLTLKFTGYCRQTSYTDSTVIHTLVPAVAWELQSQFAPVYMHFNIIFWRCLWEDMIISQRKNGDRTFFSLEVHDRLLLVWKLVLKMMITRFCLKCWLFCGSSRRRYIYVLPFGLVRSGLVWLTESKDELMMMKNWRSFMLQGSFISDI